MSLPTDEETKAGVGGRGTEKEARTLGGKDMSITLTKVRVSWALGYVQPHQIVHIKNIHFFLIHQLLLSKANVSCLTFNFKGEPNTIVTILKN